MKINLNKNQKNKQIYSNLIIQLRNYSGTNRWSLAFHGMQNKIKIIEEWREKKETKLGPLRVSKLRSPELVPFLLLPWSLYIGLGLGFSVAKTYQISFKIKIKINIKRYLERYRLFDKYSWLIIYDNLDY